MKAITLHQPWATFMAVGLKKIETRSWAPPARLAGSWVAIHAGKTSYDWDYAERLMQAVVDELGDGYEARLDAIDPFPDLERLPLGAIIAVSKLLAFRRSEDLVSQPLGSDRPLGNFEPACSPPIRHPRVITD